MAACTSEAWSKENMMRYVDDPATKVYNRNKPSHVIPFYCPCCPCCPCYPQVLTPFSPSSSINVNTLSLPLSLYFFVQSRIRIAEDHGVWQSSLPRMDRAMDGLCQRAQLQVLHHLQKGQFVLTSQVEDSRWYYSRTCHLTFRPFLFSLVGL